MNMNGFHAQRVRAQATVDLLEGGKEMSRWRVVVTGQPPYACFRVYELNGREEKDVAFEGIRRFEQEMRSLPADALAVPRRH